ncbi:hypothetical protein TNCV_2504791 [Trichonephila clavipes]|uniref:Uncharacterized protein n=1 Tax=Trichonephila clavipes TaxID=2585209 RepID=A0A8X6WHD3_TRICX|nr:hypothetical protein TNCV_2504791 [Trichonephila clavipes]
MERSKSEVVPYSPYPAFSIEISSDCSNSKWLGIQKILELIFFATAVEKNVQQTVAAAMTIVTTCNFTFRSHSPLSRKPRLSIYTGDVLVTSSTVMLRTLKNGTAALGNHSFTMSNTIAIVGELRSFESRLINEDHIGVGTSLSKLPHQTKK